MSDPSYQPSGIPHYDGNPLIEALPSILTHDEAVRQMKHFPAYDKEHRTLPDHLRFHMIQCGLRFFTPLPVHTDLERRFSCLIRGGYSGRNPLRAAFRSETEQRLNALGNSRFIPPHVWSTCSGFSIIGMSGIGKTRAVESILNLYPPVIFHNRYRNRDFTHSQIVWLKLECPYDGSPRGICTNFFQSVDRILGTTYRKNFAKDRRLTDEMMVDMANIATQHSIGVLVIDEIQRLSRAKSGGAGKLLDFFVQLINLIGVPVVLIGTYKALSILSREFSQIRRGTGQGDLIWDRMEEDEIWRLFVKSLWKYQYTREVCSLTPKLSHALYDETQGITDFAVKVYMLAQVRAITSKKEAITTGIIRSVARDSLRTAVRVLNAIRKRDNEVLAEYDDIPIIDFEKYLNQEINPPNSQETSSLPPEKTDKEDAPTSGDQQSGIAASSDSADIQTQAEEIRKVDRSSPSGTRRKPGLRIPKGELPKIVLGAAVTHDLDAYKALRQAGHIRPSSEYL